jgi:hypothetical protein
MLRKALLVLSAVAVSYGLTALAGYALYLISGGRSEAHLSILVRFIFNPLIAVLIGSLVGFLSKDRPILTTIFGLAPWAVMMQSPYKPVSIWGWINWLSPILILIPLGATVAVCAWRYRRPINPPRPLA